jgi:MFS family permease
MLVAVRCVLGLALGSDIATGFTYIMECMPAKSRDVMGMRWQFAFAMGQIISLCFLIPFLLSGMPHAWVWRATLGLGALPAFIILVLRWDLPETSMWLVRQGRFREAKRVSRQMYNDSLDMLPDQDVAVTQPSATEFFRDTARDPVRSRATYYAWLGTFCHAAQFSSFGFYLPVLFVMLGISSLVGTNAIILLVWLFGACAAWIAPLTVRRVGHKGVGKFGFSCVLAALLTAAYALYTAQNWILPFAAGLLMWGQYFAACCPMAIGSMVAKSEYRGQASGFCYLFSRSASFMAIFLFPLFTAAVGQANATLTVAIFPLAGLLGAIFLLPEVFGYAKS